LNTSELLTTGFVHTAPIPKTMRRLWGIRTPWRELIPRGRNLTVACTRPRINVPLIARLVAVGVGCAAGDAWRSLLLVMANRQSFIRAKPSLLILFACLIAISCDGHTTVKGFVYDSKDQPIQDALVTLKYSDQTFTARTDKDGAYNVGLTHGPFFAGLTLTVVKDGYKAYELSFSANSAPTGYHNVVLKP
jgi:Carboxypeptidase regulatory-like domain